MPTIIKKINKNLHLERKKTIPCLQFLAFRALLMKLAPDPEIVAKAHNRRRGTSTSEKTLSKNDNNFPFILLILCLHQTLLINHGPLESLYQSVRVCA